MILGHDLSAWLGVGLRQRLRRVWGATHGRLRMGLWFPHVLLALGVAALGALRAAPFARRALALSLAGQDLLHVPQDLLHDFLHGAPSVVLGVFMVVMALGLLFRSRLAWVIALLLTSVSLVLLLYPRAGGQGADTALLAGTAALLAGLLLAYRRFDRSSIATATLLAITSVAALLAYAVVGSYVLGNGFGPPISTFTGAFYFAVVTMATVGYGDIVPKTPEARLFVVSVMILGITVFATSVSTIVVPVVNRHVQRLLRDRDRTMKREDHYVIAGDSALARNTHKELAGRSQQVTLIRTRAPEGTPERLDVVVGDASDLDVLRRADAHAAKAILALGNDDAENAFVVLAAKELAGAARTVVVVNDAHNLPKIRRVRPDLIIAPQVIGGELLAMALSGEKVDSDLLMQHLLHFGAES